jgi:hypothetical protein
VLGGTTNNGTNNIVYSMALDNSNQILYAGGTFTAVSDASNVNLPFNYIASWNIGRQRWLPLGTNTFNGANNTVWSMKFDNSNNRLYVGGAFTLLNDASNRDLIANWIAYWNPQTQLWSTLGNSTQANAINNGTNQIPLAFTIDNSGNLFVGGQFNMVNDDTINLYNLNRHAVWNPQTNRWIRFPVVQNGTTISFSIGYLLNPLSLQPSSSFQVSTFMTSNSCARSLKATSAM